ncbi:MAG TPA: hypothetical protein VLB68_21255 [Pyrinomonadaceae bacterium]|nr:hypothetical protein [Pyrinomonadaceae bacterium]
MKIDFGVAGWQHWEMMGTVPVENNLIVTISLEATDHARFVANEISAHYSRTFCDEMAWF